jgi:hypothetical protein
MEDFIKLWELFKKSPLVAVLLVILLIAASVAGDFVHKWVDDYLNRDPFADVAGLYTGTAQGNNFRLCLLRYGTKVIGSMTWENDPDNKFYVDYSGDITKDGINLTYARNARHPFPDRGVAVISPPVDGKYGGYWESSMGVAGHETWSLVKKQPDCKIVVLR